MSAAATAEPLLLEPGSVHGIFPPGRHCSHPGCITVLSRYNAGPHCFTHSSRGKRRREDSLEQLMQQKEAA